MFKVHLELVETEFFTVTIEILTTTFTSPPMPGIQAVNTVTFFAGAVAGWGRGAVGFDRVIESIERDLPTWTRADEAQIVVPGSDLVV